jgi:hypothetical protein
VPAVNAGEEHCEWGELVPVLARARNTTVLRGGFGQMSTATTECSYWLVAPASRNLSSVHQLALAQAVGARIWISSFRVWTPSPAPSRSGRDSQTNFLPHAAEPVLGARVPAASAPGAGLRPFAGSRCSCRGRTRCCDEICASPKMKTQKSCIARAQLAHAKFARVFSCRPRRSILIYECRRTFRDQI